MQSVLASHLKYDRNYIIILIIILALWDDLLVINSHFSTQHLWVMEAKFSLNSFRLILLSLVSTHWCRKSSKARVVGVSATVCYSSFLSVPFSSAFLSSSVEHSDVHFSFPATWEFCKIFTKYDKDYTGKEGKTMQ